jgi:hypothetical protein
MSLDRLGYRFAHPPRRGPLLRDLEGDVMSLW